MKKFERIRINEEVLFVHDKVKIMYQKRRLVYCSRLRHCNAEVYTFDSAYGDWYVLRSYDTIVAAVAPDGRCYDFLRYVYGYTATSAQHISKFFSDYGCGEKYVYKEV